MYLTYQFFLEPTRAQYRTLDRILELQRRLYNAALEERIDFWRKKSASADPAGYLDLDGNKSISKFSQCKSLTGIRADDPEGYGALPVLLSRWTLSKLDEAYASFFRRVKANAGKAGFPRFRGRDGFRSFGLSEWRGIRLVGGKLLLKGVTGGLDVHMHRQLPEGSSIRSCVFSRVDRRWTVSLQVSVLEVHTVRRENDRVGLDWGVENLATLSNGDVIVNPRLGAAMQAETRRASRKLARAKRGSKRRLKTKARLARLRRRLTRKRKTYLHQVSADLTKRFGAIAVEKLQTANMTASAKGTAEVHGKNVRQKSGLNREILDTSPATLIGMLTYKAARAGGKIAVVSARNTSEICWKCEAIVTKTLAQRRHVCPHCEENIHRDVNAARNILKRAVVGPWSGNEEINGSAGIRRSGRLRAA